MKEVYKSKEETTEESDDFILEECFLSKNSKKTYDHRHSDDEGFTSSWNSITM